MRIAARGGSFSTDYQLRIIAADAIGHDVNMPPLPISYRMHSRVGAAATLEGRDLSYVMPMMPIKVLSLVPADAVDIRDASEASLGAVDSLRFRSSLFQVLTLTLGALAAVMAVLALVPLARSRRPAGDRRSRPHARSRGPRSRGRGAGRACKSRVGARRLDRRDGGARARRDAPGCGRGDRSADQPEAVAPDGAVPEGRLLVQHGLLRKTVRVTVSSPVTADDVARARSRSSAFVDDDDASISRACSQGLVGADRRRCIARSRCAIVRAR